ncbi:MAG: ferritin-like domain-containing protein [Gemmatimonadota bacterium]|nr:ferritin-like domain-containing protein [Gemmatimonadota bacterium]
MIDNLNEDLAREYQAIIAYVVYSQAIKGAEYMSIAKELEKHAKEELSHALTIAKQIDYLGGDITAVPKPVKTSDQPKEMLRFDLDNEAETIRNYRERVKQSEAMGEYAISEHIREILKQEQEHLSDLATALGIDPPKL